MFQLERAEIVKNGKWSQCFSQNLWFDGILKVLKWSLWSSYHCGKEALNTTLSPQKLSMVYHRAYN